MSDDGSHPDLGTPEIRSRAADIPQELFENILCQASLSMFSFVPSASGGIRDFCFLALVSKYFAAICRPHLFKSIFLRNHQHIRGLLALTNTFPTTFPPILTYIRSISINPDSGQDHWVHQVATVLLPQIKKHSIGMPAVGLWLLSRDLNVPRRSVTHLTMRHVTDLILSGMSFPRGEDLLHCIASFQAIVFVGLVSVTCGTTIQSPSTILTIPYVKSLRLVSAGCEICRQWLAAWMLGGRFGHAAAVMSQWSASQFTNFVDIIAILPAEREMKLRVFTSESKNIIGVLT